MHNMHCKKKRVDSIAKLRTTRISLNSSLEDKVLFSLVGYNQLNISFLGNSFLEEKQSESILRYIIP